MDEPETFKDLGKIKGFKIGHLNIRSIVKKIDQLRILTEGAGLDVLTISETWMKPHLHSSLVDLPGYKTFRLDRHSKSRKRKRGGGLISYINSKHASSCEALEELDISNNDIEAQWIYLHRPNCKDVVVCNIYRPPNGDLPKAISYLEESLGTLNIGKIDLFLMGDLNINYKNQKSPKYKKLHFFAQSNGLTQHISSTTRNNDKTKSLIDLALTNSKFIKKAGTLEHFISDHQPIYIIHKKSRDTRQSVKFEGRSYRNYDANIFKQRLRGISWENLFQMEKVEDAWDYILRNITRVLDEICPVRTFHIKNYRPDWMTKELIEQIKDRDYFFKKAKLQNDEDAWNIAKHLRNLTNANIRQAKRDFIFSELEIHDKNPKKFWKVIRKVVPTGKSDLRQDILLKDNGSKIDRNGVAHFINDYFVNVGNFKIPPPQNQNLLDNNQGTCDLDEPSFPGLTDVGETEVYRIIKDINTSKSSGIEDVSSFVLKEAFKILIPEITYMFNLSIRSSIFPTVWKQALVIPIPKTGNLTMVKNYRPISLLPLPGKILEKLIHSQLSTYLESDSLLSEKQHGFRKNHSTIHSVAQLTDYISKKMDVRLPTLAAFVDFRKAFDCVQHPLLLSKLKQLGFDTSTIDWIASYLSDRSQRVLANEVYSPYLKVTQGVPQGSVLGPLFYIVYANDLSKIVKNCEIALYADDTVLFTANNDFARSVANLQSDLVSLNRWCESNGIKANTDKTKVMVFGSALETNKLPQFDILLDKVPLQVVSTYKYLGVNLDNQLTYNLHVNKLVKSVSAKLKQFQRMRVFLNKKAAVMVYKNMLLPILEYGDIFLSATSNVNKRRLQILQNKGLRCALHKGLETSITELHAEAKLLKLKYRREQHVLNLMFENAQNNKLLRAKSNYTIKTRSSSKKLLRVKRPYTEKFRKSLTYYGPKKWNGLHQDLQHAPNKNLFKLLVSNFITNKSESANQGEDQDGTMQA